MEDATLDRRDGPRRSGAWAPARRQHGQLRAGPGEESSRLPVARPQLEEPGGSLGRPSVAPKLPVELGLKEDPGAVVADRQGGEDPLCGSRIAQLQAQSGRPKDRAGCGRRAAPDALGPTGRRVAAGRPIQPEHARGEPSRSRPEGRPNRARDQQEQPADDPARARSEAVREPDEDPQPVGCQAAQRRVGIVDGPTERLRRSDRSAQRTASSPPGFGDTAAKATAQASTNRPIGKGIMAETVAHVVGARPNFMKAAPVIRALAARGIPQLLIHTGQHYDERMSEVFFRQLGLPEPDINLGVGSGAHAVQTAAIMVGLERAFVDRRPELVVVYGDVNSTLAATVVAAKLGRPVAHVEAGLRSFDVTMPEEINRRVTDVLADLLFVTSPEAEPNLAREGVDPATGPLRGQPRPRSLGKDGAARHAGGAVRLGDGVAASAHERLHAELRRRAGRSDAHTRASAAAFPPRARRGRGARPRGTRPRGFGDGVVRACHPVGF